MLGGKGLLATGYSSFTVMPPPQLHDEWSAITPAMESGEIPAIELNQSA